jgi:C4-dicarboxylate-specific signal transduction histidine kinase
MSAMLRNLQDYYKPRHLELEVVDLNSVVNATVQQLRSAAGRDNAMFGVSRIALELSSAPLAVRGNRTDLKRLCVFLLRNAIAATDENQGGVTIRTERSHDKALLRIEDGGPTISPAQLAQIFEPHIICREGTSSLELAACQSLVRGLRGSIRAELSPGNGVSIAVSLPLTPK